jgi:hypothetical protein
MTNHSKQFESVNAVHKHMEGESHCKLHYGDDGAVEEEIAEFYDFSSRYDCSLSIVSFSSPNKCEVSYSLGFVRAERVNWTKEHMRRA